MTIPGDEAARPRTVWRSWFWNIAGSFLLVLVAVPGTISTFVSEIWLLTVLLAVMSAGMWAMTFRSLFGGVLVKSHGIVVREPARTITVPWGEIADIEGEGRAPGPSGLVGATMPIIVRKEEKGRKKKRVPLKPLGSYGAGPTPTPADRAISDLKAHLERWRRTQS